MPASSWIIDRYVRTTGRPPPGVGEMGWLDVAAQTTAMGATLAKSVVLDDAHHMQVDLLQAIRVSTSNAFATTHALGADTAKAGLISDLTGELNRRRRQPRLLLRVSAAWGGVELVSSTEGSAREGAIEVVRQGVARTVRQALQLWRKDSTRRVALVPFNRAHVPKIADLLLGLGLGRTRLFSSDLPLPAKNKFDVGGPGLYVLNALEMEGLEFDHIFVTSAEALVGDLSESAAERQLQAIVNASTTSVSLFYDGGEELPAIATPMIRAGLV